MLLVALGLVLTLVLVLHRSQDLRALQSVAGERVLRSPLLPESGWKTYGGTIWSMGYPDDWQTVATPTAGSAGVSFVDPFTNTTYLTVGETTQTLDQVDATYSALPGITKSTFLFAGYPATKFTLVSGQQDYFISYNNRIFTLSTEHPDQQEVGIMLVTFQFLN